MNESPSPARPVVAEHHSHARFLRGLSLSFLIEFLQHIRRFVLMPVLTKAFGAVNYGIWAQMGSTVDFASSLSNLGLGASMARFLPGQPRDQMRREFWMNILVITAVTGAVAAGLVALAGPLASAFFGGPGNAIFVVLGAALLLLRVVRYHLVLYFRLMLDMGWHSTVMATDTALTLLVYALVALTRGTVWSVALAAVVLEFVLTSWVVQIVVRRLGFEWPDFEALRRYLRVGLPAMPMGAASWALNSLGRFVIAYDLGTGAVGIFTVGYSLGLLAITGVAGPLWAVIPGRVNALWNAGAHDDALETLRQLLRYWILFATPIACVVVFWGRVIVVHLTRPEFAPAVAVIPWVVIAYGLEYLASHYRTVLFWTERTRVFLFSFPAAAALNLVLSVYLVPVMGILGAAVAMTASYALLLVWDVVIARRVMATRFPVRAVALSLGLGIGLGWGVSSLLNDGLLPSTIGVLVYVAVYAVICRATGLADLSEIQRGLRVAFARS